MKILAIEPLFQFGISAYKGQEVEVEAKTGKDIVERGFASEVDAKPKAKKGK